MSEKRRGLGRGLGALIPSSASAGVQGGGASTSRPVDLFFPDARKAPEPESVSAAVETPRDASEGSSSDAAASKNGSSKSTAKSGVKSPAKKAAAGTGTSKRTAASSAAVAPEESSTAVLPEAAASPAPSEPQTDLVEVPGARFAEIPVTDIHPNRKQPRSVFDEDDMAELVHSVKEIGVLQPIVVRTSTEKGGEPYELVMGERRWRAVQAAGLDTIPAIVRDTTDDDLLRDALLENLHRSQLNPLEEAAAYQQLLEDFGTTHEQLADRIGRSRPQVSNTLRLVRAA